MGKKENDEIIPDEEQFTVTLDLDDGRKVECNILTILEANGRDYIALLPQTEDEEGEVFLYRYTEGEDGPGLENILDDDEYEAVVDAFDEWLDEQEYDEIVDEEDLEEE